MSSSRASRASGTPPGSAPTSDRLLGRRRAGRAWEWVNQAEDLREKYTILARKLPGMLQVSGLGQTLAYLYGKGYKGGKQNEAEPEGRLLKQLTGYLREMLKRSTEDPMETLLSLSPAEYRLATREVAAVAEWLKRFAEGKIA